MHRKSIIVILSLAVALSFSGSIFAETIVLKSGQKIISRVLEKTDRYIKVDVAGVPVTYFLDQIESIDGKSVSASASISYSTTSTMSPSFKKDPQDIFRDVSPCIVSIISILPDGTSMQGSGFIVNSEGVIATNYHVIQNAKEVTVKLKDERTFMVTGFIYANPVLDAFIFKIDAHNLPVISIGDSDSVQTGERIYTIGNPLGFEYSISDGLISAIRPYIGKVFQITAPVSPGNSGGPLINSYGQAIGIVFFSMGGQNINMAIPINGIKSFISPYPKMALREYAEGVDGQTDYYYNKIIVALFGGDTDSMISYSSKIIQMNPNFSDIPQIYSLRGGAYAAKRQLDQALSDLNKALILKPNFSEVYENRAKCFAIMGEYNKAWEDVHKAEALGYKVDSELLETLKRLSGRDK